MGLTFKQLDIDLVYNAFLNTSEINCIGDIDLLAVVGAVSELSLYIVTDILSVPKKQYMTFRRLFMQNWKENMKL